MEKLKLMQFTNKIFMIFKNQSVCTVLLGVFMILYGFFIHFVSFAAQAYIAKFISLIIYPFLILILLSPIYFFRNWLKLYFYRNTWLYSICSVLFILAQISIQFFIIENYTQWRIQHDTHRSSPP